ncbi:MAG: hypothetical protein ACRDYU_09750 [Actinomycetes bacterium]
MDVWQMAQVILRRWYAFVPVLLLTTFATINIAESVDPEFTASSAVILMGPTQIGADEAETLGAANPYAESPEIAGASLEIALESSGVRRAVRQAGFSRDYEVIPAEWSPIVQIDARANSRAKARGTVDLLLKLSRNDLKSRQDGLRVPPSLRLSAVPVAPTSVPAPEFPGKNRVRLVVFGLGLGVSVLVAMAADVALRAARRRRERAAQQAPAVEHLPDVFDEASSGRRSLLSRLPVGAGNATRD